MRGCFLGLLWSLPTLPLFLGYLCSGLTAGITAQVHTLRWAAPVRPISQTGKSELHMVTQREWWGTTSKSRLCDSRAWALSPAPRSLPSMLPSCPLPPLSALVSLRASLTPSGGGRAWDGVPAFTRHLTACENSAYTHLCALLSGDHTQRFRGLCAPHAQTLF